MMSRVLFPLIWILLAAEAFAAEATGKETSPNFIFILSDDQSWVGSSLQIDPDDPRTRSDYYQTPHIERLAKMGMSFTQGYSPGASCNPTRRAIQTGQSPARHVYNKDREGWTLRYRDQLSIPQMLKAANPQYAAAHFGKWDMRYDKITPGAVGYDVSDGHTMNKRGGGKASKGGIATEDPKRIFEVTERSINFMQEQVEAGKPFYLQVSHYAVHLSIYFREQTLEQVEQWETGLKHTMPGFAAMTTDLDTGVGLLVDAAQELGIMDNTYIIFMSDNGGRAKVPGQTGARLPRNHPLRGGKQTLYEGGVRVPFIVIGPGIEADSISRVPVVGTDILPTLADFAHYPKELPDNIDGGSMKSVLLGAGKGTVERAQPYLFFHQGAVKKPYSALIMGDYKLLTNWDTQAHYSQLFNLADDISEARNLAELEPERVREMKVALDKMIALTGGETRRVPKKGSGKKSKKAAEAAAAVEPEAPDESGLEDSR